MSWFAKAPLQDQDEERISEIERLSEEIAELRGEVRALRTERDRTREVNNLKRDITNLQIEKAKLIEDNDRKFRETEGLCKSQQVNQPVENEKGGEDDPQHESS